MLTGLENLPAELVLRILAFLPVQSLRALRLSSRGWNTFLREHESTVYHHAAVLHNFIDSIHTLLPDAKAQHPLDFLQEVPDWYEFCRRYFQLQRNWAGLGPASIKYFGQHPYDVHRIKVDETYGLLITTHEFGGLTVFDLNTAEVLWRLDAGYVRRYAHCEYENGYLIFDRIAAFKEVWRLDVLYEASEAPRLAPPDEEQMNAWKKASRDYVATGPRGHFRPWALIDVPEPVRAYRFVYPTLLVCGTRNAFLWDVRSGALVQEVENVQGSGIVGEINYVEFGYADVQIAITLEPAIARRRTAGPSDTVWLPWEPLQSSTLYTASYAEFSAVHASRDGKNLVAQLSDGRLLVVRDFQRVISGEVSLRAAALEVGKNIPRVGQPEEHFSIYLTYEYGRLGIVTTSGIYATTLDPTHHMLIDEDLVRTGRKDTSRIPREAIDAGTSFPYNRFVSLPFYHDRRQLSKVTCIQITETRLFFVWDAMYKPESIDFFRSLGMVGTDTPPEGPPPDEGAGGGAAMGPGQNELAHGLFTTLDTLAQEAAQEVQEVQGAAAAAETEDEQADAEWDEQAVEESQLLLDHGHEGHEVEDNPGVGPSTALVDAHDDEDFADQDEWDEDLSDDGSLDGEPQGVEVVQHLVMSTGPIVYCIDFTPR